MNILSSTTEALVSGREKRETLLEKQRLDL